MSGYLLDTNAASEARKRQRANPNVLKWFASVADTDLFLSVLVLGEIRKGIELARRFREGLRNLQAAGAGRRGTRWSMGCVG